jgi:hypothetical protein
MMKPLVKKRLKELFAARDRSQPGSNQEKRAAEKILEMIFTDTNADCEPKRRGRVIL